MIVYRKTFHGLHLLFRLYGSAIVRTLIWFALAAGQTAMLYVLMPDSYNTYFSDSGRTSSYAIFSTMVALLVIFRQTASYGRFHEGRTKLQCMTAAWTGACSRALSFDGGAHSFGRHPQQLSTRYDSSPTAFWGAAQQQQGGNGGSASAGHHAGGGPASVFAASTNASNRFALDIIHLFSLLHGTAVQFLRSDWVLANIAEHDQEKLPPWDSGNSPEFHPRLIDYLVLRASSARRLPFNAAHPVPVIGGLGPHEEAALYFQDGRQRTFDKSEYQSANFAKTPSVAQRARHHLFQHAQGKYARGAAERVYQVFHWLHERCRQRMVEGGLDMPAPILATVFTSLQTGLDAFEQCRYLCDTPFPFAWSQMIIFVLLCFQFTLPFVIVSTVQDWALGIVISAMTAMVFWSLNEVSRELEDPYTFEPNDIPLARLQFQFNERILAAANTQVPTPESMQEQSAFREAVREAVAKASMGSVEAPDPAHAPSRDRALASGAAAELSGPVALSGGLSAGLSGNHVDRAASVYPKLPAISELPV